MKQLPKVVAQRKKRVGRGLGSGKGGHTVGRGVKGQKARGKVGILFEGLKVKKSLLRRLPIVRGKAKFKGSPKPLVVDLTLLNALPQGAKVNIETLAKAGIVGLASAQKYGVKILGHGGLKKKLIVEVPISKQAAQKVVKKGGKIVKAK